MSNLRSFYKQVESFQKKLKKQLDYAARAATNNIAFDVKDAIYKEFDKKFKPGAQKYTKQSFKVRKATKQKPVAEVFLRLDGPGKGTPYVDVLGHHFTGGERVPKRFEKALIHKGWMKRGQIAVPTKHVPRDKWGDPKKAFIIKLMSVLKLFSETGYIANMTERSRKRLKKQRTFGGYKITKDEQWFISKGPGTIRRARGKGKALQNLPAGIWRKRGRHGAVVDPLFLFVDQHGYEKLFDLEQIGDRVAAQKWEEAYEKALEHALKTARW